MTPTRYATPDGRPPMSDVPSTSLAPVSVFHPPVEVLNPGPILGGPLVQTRPAVLDATPDARSLFNAFRRRWVLATLLSIISSALIGIAAWYLVPPAKYEAVSVIRVAQYPKRIIFDPRTDEAEFRTLQQSTIAAIKNQNTLRRALRLGAISKLPTLMDQTDPVDWLEKQMKVDVIGASEYIAVMLSGDRPDDLAAIVNAVVDSFIELGPKSEAGERQARLQRLRKLKDEYEDLLKSQRNRFKELAEQVGVSDQKALSYAQQFKQQEMGMARTELLKAQGELRKLRSDLDVLENMQLEPRTTSADIERQINKAVESDPGYIQQLQTVNQLQEQVRQLSRVGTNRNDPSLTRVKRSLEAASQGLVNMRADLRRSAAEQLRGGQRDEQAEAVAKLQGQIQGTETYIKALQEQVSQLGEDSNQIAVKGQDIETERETINVVSGVTQKIKSEIEAMEVEKDAPERISVFSQATPPKIKDEMRKIKLVGATSVAALLSVLMGVTFWEYRARRVSTTDEVVRGLGMRLVGSLPVMPEKHKVVTDRRWQSMFVESVDAMRAVLLHAAKNEPMKVVLITSAVKGEGKTTLSCHLATSMARAGRRTLLVDCDLRNPAAHRLFDLSVNPGLCDFLRGEAEIMDLIQTTPAANLSILPAGRSDPISLQSLAQDGLRGVFTELRDHYDFIIVDSAPVLPVADTLLICPNVDGVLFSVLRDVSRLPSVYAAYERLSQMGTKLLGAVVTGVQYGRYGDEYYYYGSQNSGARTEGAA